MASWDSAPLVDDKPTTPAWQSAPVESERPMPKRSDAKPISKLERVETGMLDPVVGLGQIAGHLGVDRLNQWIDKLGIPGLPKATTMDEAVRTREAGIKAGQEAAGVTGTDWMRLAGNVASPVNMLPGAALAKVPMASLSAKVAGGALAGVLGGATAPVTQEGDFLGQKTTQANVGAVTGGTVPGAGAAASRLISPKTAQAVTELRQAGVQLTPGQTAGGMLRAFEEKLKSVPIVGDIIKASERRATEDFNRVAIDRSLANIGKKLPPSVSVGHDGIAAADDMIGSAYDSLLSKMKGRIDAPMVAELANLRAMGQAGLPKEKADQLSRIIDQEVVGRFTKQGGATGETLKQIDSKLGGEARRMLRSEDYDVRNMGAALIEVKNSLRSMLARANPKEAPELAKIDRAYAEFQRVQVAAARQGAKDGLFTPAQLRSAVRQLDSTMRKKAFSKGDALMQDLAESGEKVLSPTIPDSGTAGRAMAAGALANPTMAALALGPSLPMSLLYSRLGQSVINPLLASRPSWAPQAAQALQRGAPYAGVPMATMAGQLSNQP
jgi:hypothetical protein